MASDGWSAYIPPCKCLQRTLNPQFRIKLPHRACISFLKDVEPQRLRPAGIVGQLWVTAVGTRSRKATRPTMRACLHEWRGRRGRRGRWKGGRFAVKSRDTCICVASRQPDQQLLVGPRTSRLDHSRVPILLMARPYADRNEDSLHRGSAPDPQSDPGALDGWHSIGSMDGIPESHVKKTWMTSTGHVMKSRSTWPWSGLVEAWAYCLPW